MTFALLILKILHVLSAATLVGSVIFNYFLLRPSLRLIPPAHAVVIGQRVGTLFTWTGWITLVILAITGGLRLYVVGAFWDLFTLDFYTTSSNRAIGLMVLSWLVAVISASVMTWLLRPTLMHKLAPQSNPTLADVERRRLAQMNAAVWLDRLQLVNVVATVLAAVAGASVFYGGLL